MVLVRIVPAPKGDEGLRVTVRNQDGTQETWKAFAVEIELDLMVPHVPVTPQESTGDRR